MTQPPDRQAYTDQSVLNSSFDTDFGVLAVEQVLSDGASLKRAQTNLVATKITTPDSSTTYIAIAPIGTTQATAGWQVKKILVTGNDTVITWANGSASFTNVATDLTVLNYS